MDNADADDEVSSLDGHVSLQGKLFIIMYLVTRRWGFDW
jgi:hypothetical protein